MSKLFQTISLILLTSLTTKTCRCRPETKHRSDAKYTIKPQTVNQTIPAIDDPNKPNGIPNVGNTCFMNSVLQILAGLYIDEIKKAKPDHSKEHNQLINFLNKINTPGNTITAQDATDITDLLRKVINNNYPKNKETLKEGAPYYTSLFLNHLNSWLKFLKNTEYTDIDTEYCVLQSPGYSLIRNEPCILLYKHNENVTLQDAIYQMHNDNSKNTLTSSLQTNEENNIVYYNIKAYLNKDNTGQNTLLYHAYIYHTIPEKIVFQVENHKPIIQNESLSIDIINKAIDLATKKTEKFTLKGMVIHHPLSTIAHYTAYIKKQDKWYYANDTMVKSCTLQEVIEDAPKAELFFYEKVKKTKYLPNITSLFFMPIGLSLIQSIRSILVLS